MEAGASWWRRGLQWRPYPLCATQQWRLASMVAWAFLQTFPVVERLTPIPSGCLFTANSWSPPSVHSPNPTFQHPAPLLTRRHATQAGVSRAVAQTICLSLTLSCFPETCCYIPLWSPEVSFLSQLISPPWRGFSECRNLSSPSPLHQGCWSLPISYFLFFLSFILPSCVGIFFVLLGVWGLLLVFSRCSVRIVPFVDVFLMYLWGEVNSISSYSSILTPPWDIFNERQMIPCFGSQYLWCCCFKDSSSSYLVLNICYIPRCPRAVVLNFWETILVKALPAAITNKCQNVSGLTQ